VASAVTFQVPTLVTFVVKRVVVHFPAVSTWIFTVVPERFGLRDPYKVSKVSEALGVCLTDIDKVDVAATDCGAPTTATIKDRASR
jgi:hypothetical protein